MPHSQYVPRRCPPSLKDRYYLDPHGVALAVGSMLIGLLLIPAAFFDFAVSRALDGLHGGVLLSLAGALIVGSGQFLHASMKPRESWPARRVMRIKRGGTISLTCGWLGYSLATIYTGNPYALVAIIMASSIAAGYYGRRGALKSSENTVAEVSKHMGADEITEG